MVELGAETQIFLKIPLPTLKSRSRLKGMLAEGCENAFRFKGLNTVALPAGRRSYGSALEKSCVGCVTAAIRVRSSSGSAAGRAWAVANSTTVPATAGVACHSAIAIRARPAPKTAQRVRENATKNLSQLR